MVVQMQASLQLHDASKMASHTQRRKRALSSDSSGSDVSFHQTDAEPSKANRLGISTNSALREGVTAFTCTLPPTCSPSQPTKFSTSDSLSAHYQSHHAHVCSAAGCRKMFPSEIFLDLHLNEWHNPMNQVRLERGDKIYRCFESSCTRSFGSPKTRRLHLVDYHQYPRQFFFSLPKHGLNQLFHRYGPGASLVRPDWKPREAKSTATPSRDTGTLSTSPSSGSEGFPTLATQSSLPEQQEVYEAAPKESRQDHQVDQLSHQLERAKLDMIPKQVKFGNRKAKGFSAQ